KSLKWGMFICWSFSTFSGQEWTPGVKDISLFKATEVDTDQWAKTAKECGMGYIVFLTKHHDGFCLWDTKTTDRKVTKSPLGKDVLRLLRKSCDKYGIKLALYFSENEFGDNKNYHPDGYSVEMKKAQIRELLTEYGPIEYMWFDHALGDAGLSHADTAAWCKQFQPGCFIGFNGGRAAGDIRVGEEGHPAALDDASGGGLAAHDMVGYKGYLAAEFTYPILPTSHQGGAYYFYSLPKHDGLCHPAEKLYRDYVGAVKFGNVFSVNIGPDYKGRIRDIDVKTLYQVGKMIRKKVPLSALSHPVRAFCVDFNWGPGGPNGFAKPGLWADADPVKHVEWYRGLGVNVIQTFAVSCNGYAWYKGGKIPEQPGLAHDFLPEVVKLGHGRGMKVMGYFCVAANTRWGQEHPDLSYGIPNTCHLPFTDEYLDYLGMAIEEALEKSGMDGFMIDWVWNPAPEARGGKWLGAEKKLFEQLTGKQFPGEDKLTQESMLDYQRKATDRCWERIRSTAKRVKPDCVIWLSCNNVRDPVLNGSKILGEIDWLMDESGNPQAMRAITPVLGTKTKQILCLVGWGDQHNAQAVVENAANQDFGIYGFAKPNPDSLPLPVATYLGREISSFGGDDRNIAVLARFFNGKLPEKSGGLPFRASSEWGAGYEAGKAVDGDESTRWSAAPDTRNGWLEIDLGKEKKISKAVVVETSFSGTEAFVIEYKDGDRWKPAVNGTTIAGKKTYEFKPVKARYFRLNITKANQVPTIDEFQLY
ncbi:MAG: alpha-L-fucosidase, partial [bacterium]